MRKSDFLIFRFPKSAITSYFSPSQNKRLKCDESLSNNLDKVDSEKISDDASKPKETSRKNVNIGTFVKWQKQFPWLQMLDSNLMICNVCKDFVKPEDSSFVNGCPAFRFETVKKHDISVVHGNACKAKLAREKPSETPLALARKAMDADLITNMSKLFNTAYLIAKEDYAFDDFPALCQLQVKNGLKIGETYLNDKSAKQFVKYMADCMRSSLKDHLSKIEYFSLIADGSTDKSVQASEIIYLCYLLEGEPQCSYISLLECEDATAIGIKDGIVSVLEKFVPDWQRKLTAVSFDGASVNMGEHAGVAKLFENYSDKMISIHCVAHRLELAMSDAIKDVKYIHILEVIMKGIYSYYHHSPKRTKALKNVGEVLDNKILAHVNLHKIRWLQSRHRAVKVLLNNLAAVITHMEQVISIDCDKNVSAKLKGYLKNLKNERFLKSLCLLEDVTNLMARVSEIFQQRNISMSEVLLALESTVKKLSNMITDRSTTLKNFESELNISESSVLYKDIRITSKASDKKSFEADRISLLEGLIKSLQKRYHNLKTHDVFSNIDVLDPCNVANLNPEGNKKVNEAFKKMIEALPTNVNIDKEVIMDEFEDFKVWSKNKLNIPRQSAWQRLLAETSSLTTFHNLKKLLNFIMIIPLSTAECERGFSHLNLIKTPTRLRLLLPTVDDLLFIRLYGPSLKDYDPRPAINMWWNDVEYGRSRRPNFKKS